LEIILQCHYLQYKTFLSEIGWRAEVSPADHPVYQYEFDVLIGADGKRNTLDGVLNFF
jgi:hypothetical protein